MEGTLAAGLTTCLIELTRLKGAIAPAARFPRA